MAVLLNTAHLINDLIEVFFPRLLPKPFCSKNVVLTVSPFLSLTGSYSFVSNEASTSRQQSVNKAEKRGKVNFVYNRALSPHHDWLK
jgi:hypothetical protein